MLQQSRRLSDIRSEGAPAFLLTSTFSFVGDNLEKTQGTYTEIWVSDSQWRRETLIGEFRYVEVSNAGKHWLLYPDGFPLQAQKLPTLMAVLPPAALALDFAVIREHAAPGVVAECAYSRPVIQNFQFVLCFDKKNAVLLEKVFPEKRPRNVVNFSCEYGTFRKFGEYSFPREVVCFDDRHKTISANVVELTIGPRLDPAMFNPPSGSIELDQCRGKTVTPILSRSEVRFPGLDLDSVAWIQVWFVVDAQGKPQNLKILKSMDKASHERALNSVRSWRFKPGTCDGKPVPMQMTIEIPSTPR
jgi:hypothetical protein